MKLGAFCEHQLPKLWEAHSEYQLMQDSMAQNIVLEELYAELPRLHSHQSEDTVRMLPEQLKAMMAEREVERVAVGDD